MLKEASTPGKMKGYPSTNVSNVKSKITLYILFSVAGLLAGYLYWHFYGCVHGCSITGVWYNSSAYGGLMGFLVGGMVWDRVKPKS